MAKPIVLPFRRRRQGKTDYKHRLNMLKAQKARAVIRPSVSNMLVQVATYKDTGDNVEIHAHTRELRALGYKGSLSNLSAAYLIGLVAGKKALAAKKTELIADIRGATLTPGARVYATLKGLIDAGVQIPHDAKVLPSEERVLGKHIDAMTTNKKSETHFTRYKKEKIDAGAFSKHVEDIKAKIMG